MDISNKLSIDDFRFPISNFKSSVNLITVATKADLLSKPQLEKRLARLNSLLGTDALVTSAETGYGVDRLRISIDKRIVELTSRTETAGSGVALTVRHRQTVVEAIENVSESVNELKVGNDEVAAMMLRAAYYDLSNIQQQHIDEQILENIFRRFCIGK